ncbi:MAG: hypothetical protein WBG38_05235 [Nodosilinea sp.]
MSDRPTDFQLHQAQGDIEELATKILQSTRGLTFHQAYIRAVRLLGQTQ